ncbi:hypothetical protein JJC00_20230 [Bradyrhizobium diazoefficiens]|uniref:hypothetical protein n=1 Tax=Bradyrhizobium diazoefficiens TaxID=1355477 RepID=UPI00190D1517|nr:hypothetical protein [Bradyrhizobium diazoefficiens]QQO30995.1 hypothetical protein JJC00_20230 [Bradyrhizobium diazoefficiens]
MKSVPAKMSARRNRAGGTFLVSRYAIQIRDGFVDTTARLRTRYRLMIFTTRGMKKPLAFAPAADAGFENGSGMKYHQPRYVPF